MKDTNEMIQRLIDGEMDDAGRRELMLYLDNEAPERWRDVGLGFLEAQMFEAAFQPEKVATVAASPRAIAFPRWAGELAAGLLIGIVCSWMFISPNQGDPVLSATQGGDEKALSVSEDDSMKSLEDQLIGASGESGALHELTQFLKDIGSDYANQGMETAMSSAYVMADLENGDQVVIPVRYLAASQNN